MKIIADENIPYLKGIAEQYGTVEYIPGNEFTADNVIDADTLIIRTIRRMDEDLLHKSKVKLICSATIGYDHIDTTYCGEHGIKWTNAPGCNSGSVMQYITSALIYLAQNKSLKLQEMTIGIIGVGNVGKKVATTCELLGMRILLNDPPREEKEKSARNNNFVDIETIKNEADIITFHTPLICEGKFKTLHLADDNFFDSLAKKPWIFNTARGAIVATSAIKKALQQKKIRGAVIDCWENEPNIDLEYMAMTDIATPHIAGYSADGKANASRMSIEEVAKFWNMPLDYAEAIKPPLLHNNKIEYSEIFTENKMYACLYKTYDIEKDDNLLRKNPRKFKDYRNNYPIRREYLAYEILGLKDKREIEQLKKIGFIIK